VTAHTAVEHQRARQAAAAGLQTWQLRSRLALMRAALRGRSTMDELLARQPALHDTLDQAAAHDLADLTLDEALRRLDEHLLAGAAGPLERLRKALCLDADGLSCFVVAALPDAEPQLTGLLDELHGQGGRPTRATLARAFGAGPSAAAVQALGSAGALCEEARVLSVPRTLWDMACGLPPSRGAWRHQPWDGLRPLDQLILPDALRGAIEVARSLDVGPRCWVLRGGPGSGRHALAGALAHAAGLGLLQACDPSHGQALGAAAALLGAMPLADFEPAPGESVGWLIPPGAPNQAAALMPRHGDLVVDGAEPCRLDLAPPNGPERRAHWRRALGGAEPAEELVALRVPRATLHRLARRVPPASPDPLSDVLRALEDQGRHALDGMARAVPPAGAEEAFALPEAAREEFDALVLRCRHRDRLAAALPAAYGAMAGVRALFKGPSGTGKTLAARQLAAALRRPLYRVDLAATLSKYIGETERNLERVFEAAESLDIVLLLDEGDALLAGRTGVSNATDRFARRMDVSIEFPLPDADTRLALWQAHLGPAHHVDASWLERVALRCALSGGLIRNAALQAALLAIERGGAPGVHELQQALEREYRKAGQHCPSLDDDD